MKRPLLKNLLAVGAIVVLMIFAVVLTERITSSSVRQANHLVIPGALLCVALLAGLISVIRVSAWPALETGPQQDTIKIIGRQLLSTHVEAFEVASVLLLAALVGAVFLGKEITKK